MEREIAGGMYNRKKIRWFWKTMKRIKKNKSITYIYHIIDKKSTRKKIIKEQEKQKKIA